MSFSDPIYSAGNLSGTSFLRVTPTDTGMLRAAVEDYTSVTSPPHALWSVIDRNQALGLVEALNRWLGVKAKSPGDSVNLRRVGPYGDGSLVEFGIGVPRFYQRRFAESLVSCARGTLEISEIPGPSGK
jgi:hypothetical protein